jgi:hypothetical protein
MRGISNRKEIINQIPLLATGKVKFIPVIDKNTKIGEIYCNRVEYGEYEVGFSRRNISEENIVDINWRIVDNFLDHVCYLINKTYNKPFRLEPKEVRDFWFSRVRL